MKMMTGPLYYCLFISHAGAAATDSPPDARGRTAMQSGPEEAPRPNPHFDVSLMSGKQGAGGDKAARYAGGSFPPSA